MFVGCFELCRVVRGLIWGRSLGRRSYGLRTFRPRSFEPQLLVSKLVFTFGEFQRGYFLAFIKARVGLSITKALARKGLGNISLRKCLAQS